MINSHWKNCPPEETVQHISNLLAPYGIKLKTRWLEDDNPLQIYSNFVTPFDQLPCFKTAGKGLTPAYAQASGFAEFIERFQTFMIYYRNYRIPFFKDEYLDENNVGKYPYLNLLTGETVDMPSYYCNSTGMASGNTDKEAMVHAICEIVERQTYMDFIHGDLQVNSRIPTEKLSFNFDELENMFMGKVQIFDVGRFNIPTVLIICRNEVSRKLFFKIDCGPTIELAAERCLTEFFQNNVSSDMRYYYWQGNIPSTEITADTIYSITVDYHMGPIPFDLITKIEDAPVREEYIDYIFETEEALIQTFLRACKNEYKYSAVYLRDFKWAGFPTVYIYVPDIIEREHPNLKPSGIFTQAFDYAICEYETYFGTDTHMLENILSGLLRMFIGKPDPIVNMKRFDDSKKAKNPYLEITQRLLEQMKETCSNFAMDIDHFKAICNL